MSRIIDFDNQGHIVYNGLLSQEEVESYQEIIDALQKEFPEIEKELLKKYPSKKANGTSIEYKYYLGKAISEYLNKYDVTEDERRRFFDEIKNLASEKTKELYTRDSGKKSKTRSIFEQFYLLSQLSFDTVLRLNWGEWQPLFDRVICREDPRIFAWIDKRVEKVSRSNWRSFMKVVNMYAGKFETALFSEDEFFDIFDSLLLTGSEWVSKYDSYKKDHPDSAKNHDELKWSKKFYQKCFEIKKQKRLDVITKEIIDRAFFEVMEKDFDNKGIKDSATNKE